MPTKAKDNTGSEVEACKVPVKERNKPYFCCTAGCSARMILVKAGNTDAYFKSKHRGDHISANCIKNSIKFLESKYNESKFDLNYAFETMLGKKHTSSITRGSTGTRTGTVGGSTNLKIRTLRILYAMCLDRGKSGNYNGFNITDILADEENFSKYSAGISGYKIVELSKYHYVSGKDSFIMNYPADNRGKNTHVKIVFSSKQLLRKHYNDINDSGHTAPIIIAGEWKTVTGNPSV